MTGKLYSRALGHKMMFSYVALHPLCDQLITKGSIIDAKATSRESHFTRLKTDLCSSVVSAYDNCSEHECTSGDLAKRKRRISAQESERK